MVHGRDLLPGYENCNFLFLPDLYKATFSHGKKKRGLFFSFPRRKDVILKLERRDDRQWENKVRAILPSVVFSLL